MAIRSKKTGIGYIRALAIAGVVSFAASWAFGHLLQGTAVQAIITPDAERAQKSDQGRRSRTRSQTLVGSLKQLETLIDGNGFDDGSPNSNRKHDSYRYEGFYSAGCSAQWRETHEAGEAGQRLSVEVINIAVSLSVLDSVSVRTDKVGYSRYLVSFTTLELKPLITSRTVFPDGSASANNGLQSGYGFYFTKNQTAQKAARALVSAIHSCRLNQVSSSQ